MNVFVIGIAGGTASGKSTLAKRLVAVAEPEEAQILPLDAFYWDGDRFPPAISHPEKNFDHPDALDFDLICRAIDLLRTGQPAEIPVYDFATHKRSGTENLAAAPLLIVEGIHVLGKPEVRQRLDYSVFVDVPSEERFRRRLKRDVAHRGRTAESVTEQWQSTVAPMYQQFVQPHRELADHVSDGSDFDSLIDKLISLRR